MKSQKGFTLIEVVVSIALLGIIAVGFLSVMANQFNMLIHARKITENTFLAQQGIEIGRAHV